MTHKLGCPLHTEKWAGRAMNHSRHHYLLQWLSNGTEAQGANLSSDHREIHCCCSGVATTSLIHRKGTDIAAAFLQSSWWQLSQCRTQLWCPIPSLFQMTPSHDLPKYHLHEVVVPKEAVTPAAAATEKWQIIFPELTDLLCVKRFLNIPLSQPQQRHMSLCFPLVAGLLVTEAPGPERPLRSWSPVIFYCRQTHYISPLINVINRTCKNSLG